MRVLFVCTANICRSAYAEVVARQVAGPDSALEFVSAGTHAGAGKPMDPPMAAEALRAGAEPGGHQSHPLTAALVDSADLVLTAEARHRRRVLEDWPMAVRKTFSLGQFVRGLHGVDGAGAPLLEQVRRHAATASDDEDVADPYGRGEAMARATAEEIDRLLGVILPALS